MAPQVIIGISKLSHTYPGTRKTSSKEALKKISLDIHAGEMVAFLGPNGSGKSTLLRILTTILRPSSGAVRMGDIDLIRNPHAARRNLGVVFQNPALDAKMKVCENLKAAGLLYGIPRKQLKQRIESILRGMDLLEWRDDLVETLSGGLARRVELAKALLPHPRLLILDEPTTGLDPVARQEFWRTIESLRARDALTVLVSTHLLDEAERCDRVAILDQGNLLAFDQPGRLQCQVGGEVLSIEGDDIGNLQDELREFLNIEGQVVDNALRLTLPQAISLDDLRQNFQTRIKKLTLSHPSLDDVFVYFTGKHLTSEETLS